MRWFLALRSHVTWWLPGADPYTRRMHSCQVLWVYWKSGLVTRFLKRFRSIWTLLNIFGFVSMVQNRREARVCLDFHGLTFQILAFVRGINLKGGPNVRSSYILLNLSKRPFVLIGGLSACILKALRWFFELIKRTVLKWTVVSLSQIDLRRVHTLGLPYNEPLWLFFVVYINKELDLFIQSCQLAQEWVGLFLRLIVNFLLMASLNEEFILLIDFRQGWGIPASAARRMRSLRLVGLGVIILACNKVLVTFKILVKIQDFFHGLILGLLFKCRARPMRNRSLVHLVFCLSIFSSIHSIN